MKLTISHFPDEFTTECTHHAVRMIVEPPGSSDQIQALDLGIFGIQKRIKSGIRKNPDIDPQSDDIRKIVNSFIRAVMPENVTSAFHQAGISFDCDEKGFYYTVIDMEQARAVRHTEHKHYEIPPGMQTTFKLT